MKQIVCVETGDVVCQETYCQTIPDIFKEGRVRTPMGAPNAVATIYGPTLELRGIPRKSKVAK